MMNRRRLLYLFIVGGILLADQLTKLVARASLLDGRIVRVFDSDLLWFVLVFNPGSAFGVRLIPPTMLAIVNILASLGLGYYLFSNSSLKRLHGTALALVMGGALGNLWDRLTLGEVTDFVSVNMPDILMYRFPVFNIADSAVSIGVVMMVIMMFFNLEKEEDVENIENVENVQDAEDAELTDVLEQT